MSLHSPWQSWVGFTDWFPSAIQHLGLEWVYFTEDGSAEPEVWEEQSKQQLPQTAGMLQEVLGW